MDSDTDKEPRKAQFYEKLIAHQAMEKAQQELMATLRKPVDGQIVIVTGPPGVGKSTLRNVMIRDLNKAFLKKADRNPGHIAVVGIELEAFQSGNYNWKKTRTELLKATHEPLTDKKVMYRHGIRDNQGLLQIDSRISSDDLGEILVDVIKNRQPNVLWFDEAQHLVRVRGANDLIAQMDIIKSLANRSKTPVVLFGTYEMNALLDLSSQLMRRTRLIHFARYRLTHNDKNANDVDLKAFKEALFGFQKALPFAEEPDLIEHWPDFFSGSLGCIGNLKNWLMQAVSEAIENELPIITMEIIDKWRKDEAQLYKMDERISLEEQNFYNGPKRFQLHQRMSLPAQHLTSNQSNNDIGHQKPRKRKTAPGERLPTRDPVGIKHNEI